MSDEAHMDGSLTLAGIRETEKSVENLHAQGKKGTIEISNELVDVIYAGLSLTTTPDSDSVSEITNRLLTTAINLYLKVIDLATAGYYVIAMYLARFLAECWLAALYVREKPEEADNWRSPDFKQMSRVAFVSDEQLSKKMSFVFHELNLFAHASPATLAAAIEFDNNNTREYRLGRQWSSRISTRY